VRSSAVAARALRDNPPFNTFYVGRKSNSTLFACINKRVRYSSTELIKIRKDSAMRRTTTTAAALGLRATLARLLLLRTVYWRCRVRRTKSKRKRCAQKQKRGKRGGLLARLKDNAGRLPILSLFLSNVCSLDNKMDVLRLRLCGALSYVTLAKRHHARAYPPDRWPASFLCGSQPAVGGKPTGADYVST